MCAVEAISLFYFSFGGYGKTTTWVVAAKVRFGVVGTQRKDTRRVVYVTARGRFEEKTATFFKKKLGKDSHVQFWKRFFFCRFFWRNESQRFCRQISHVSDARFDDEIFT